jgi:predicted DCC family thiol-disulfide oxidoreductase YuxK
MSHHLIFYDGECGLCDLAVQFVIQRDVNKLFFFAPLQGKTASNLLQGIPAEYKNSDSLILIEDFQSDHPKISILAKGALRICSLLGGALTPLGWLYSLPAPLTNWAYRLVARNRHRLFPLQCTLPTKENASRFLP